MARRCLDKFYLNNVEYEWLKFSDLSFLTDSTGEYDNGTQSNNISSLGTDIFSIGLSDSTYEKTIDNTYQGKISKTVNGDNTFFRLYTKEISVCASGTSTVSVSSRHVYWAVVLDDTYGIGWAVNKHFDNHCYSIGGNNNTGKAIYQSFMNMIESPSGGAGSGYIGNTLVSNKKMVGYNIPTSSAESTKTESVNEASESPVSGKPKIGNGYAKIKLISEYPPASWRRTKVLLDDANNFKDDIFNSFAQKIESGATGYYYIDGNTLKIYRNGRNTEDNGNAECKLQQGIVINKATTLYIDVEIPQTVQGRWRRHGVYTYKTPEVFEGGAVVSPSYGYYDFVMFNDDTYTGYTCDGSNTYPALTRQTVEIRIDNVVSPIVPFYLGFAKCNTPIIVRKIYFDDDIAIVPLVE